MKILEFFSDGDGKLSNVRLNTSLCVYVALLMVLYNTHAGKTIDYTILLLLLGFGFGAKLSDKYFELKAQAAAKVVSAETNTGPA